MSGVDAPHLVELRLIRLTGVGDTAIRTDLSPGSMGSLLLGETFRGILILRNMTSIPVSSPSIISEIQTNTQTVETGRITAQPKAKEEDGKGVEVGVLGGGEYMELPVEWEIKELGMHFLGVGVRYESSSGKREFSSVFKSNATAPLAIKTKTHLPFTPNALLDSSLRETSDLEISLQNISGAPITFTRLTIIPIPGLNVDKAVLVEEGSTKVALPAGGVKQLHYRLRPVDRPEFPKSSLFPVKHNPGQTIALGRLDVAWENPYGETGKLITSVLNRKVPATLPSLRVDERVAGSAVPPRIRAPISLRPSLDFLRGAAQGSRPGTPGPEPVPKDDELEVDVTVRDIAALSPVVGKEVKLGVRIAVGRPGNRQESLHLAYQYLDSQLAQAYAGMPSTSSAAATVETSTRNPSRPPSSLGPSSSRLSTPQPYSLSRQPSISSVSATPANTAPPPPPSMPENPNFPPYPLPSPAAASSQPDPSKYPDRYTFTGVTTTIFPLTLLPLDIPQISRDESPRPSIDGEQVLPPPPQQVPARSEGFLDVELRFFGLGPGLIRLGGLRVLSLQDPEDITKGGKVLAEWSTLGELYVERPPRKVEE